MTPLRLAILLASTSACIACSRQPPAPGTTASPRPEDAPGAPSPRAADEPAPSTDSGGAASTDADAVSANSDDPVALHKDTAEELLALPWPPTLADGGTGALSSYFFAPTPGRFNHGNRAIARHAVGKATCLRGLEGITLQTEAQRAQCKGAENMVPIYEGGKPEAARACIDVFEFPNRACELPMVWGSPAQAQTICAQQGKRLCSDREWNLGCGGDPAGKERWIYAYGNEMDSSACNTEKPHEFGPDGKQWRCNVHDARSAWSTCSTDTEPSGAFPRCRSRFGVYDQHGNVAEEMTRIADARDGREPGTVLTQLKGSAFFYVDVSRRHDQAQPKDAPRETYPDHCGFDPRWHVEVLKDAQHVNYHLGFRCCKSI